MSERLYKASQFYHSLGWSMLPVKTDGSKEPATTSWNEFRTRLNTQEELKEWFLNKSLNIGLVCGKLSNIAAVDDDKYKSQGGQIKLASVLTSNTPSGGMHYFYKYHEGLANIINDELAVDIKTEGGYVLLPPSSNNGVEYTWNTRSKMDFVSLPELPINYLEKFKVIQKESEPFDFNKAFGAKEGCRDISLYKAACSLLARGVPSKLVYLFLLFLDANLLSSDGKAKKPLGETEVKRKFESAVTKHLKNWEGFNGSI